MFANWDGLVWLLLVLGPLLILQRSLHRNIQAVFLLITRRAEVSIALFSLLFLPGVILHEVSHYLMARLLGVHTGKLSILPRAMPDSKLQLGYVETEKTDIIRDALIGAAPLVTGGLFVAYAGLNKLGLDEAWFAAKSLDAAGVWEQIKLITSQQDFWLWFYLAFTVSSTMLPSSSDRRAWPSLAIVLTALFVLALILGAGPWMAETLAPWFNTALLALDIVLVMSVLFHLVFLPPVWILRQILERLTGMKVA